MDTSSPMSWIQWWYLDWEVSKIEVTQSILMDPESWDVVTFWVLFFSLLCWPSGCDKFESTRLHMQLQQESIMRFRFPLSQQYHRSPLIHGFSQKIPTVALDQPHNTTGAKLSRSGYLHQAPWFARRRAGIRKALYVDLCGSARQVANKRGPINPYAMNGKMEGLGAMNGMNGLSI